MTCYTVTTCVFSGGSRPSDKRGGGQVIQSLSPEIREMGGLKKIFWALRASVWSRNNKRGGGGLET